MIDVYTLATIFFRLLNFGVVIGLVWYWYRRSVHGTMLKLLQKKKERFEVLEQQNVTLIREQDALGSKLKNQEVMGKEILARMHTWRSIVEAATSVQQQEQQALHDQAVKRKAIQEKQWELWALQQATIEPTLKETEALLKKKFSSEQQGSLYVQSIVAELEKRI